MQCKFCVQGEMKSLNSWNWQGLAWPIIDYLVSLAFSPLRAQSQCLVWWPIHALFAVIVSLYCFMICFNCLVMFITVTVNSEVYPCCLWSFLILLEKIQKEYLWIPQDVHPFICQLPHFLNNGITHSHTSRKIASGLTVQLETTGDRWHRCTN